jgi:ADP-ribosyl-[dinitrogen reductase] hydrolase
MPQSDPQRTSNVERRQAAIWGSLIGDAIAMPVHWYYDRDAMRRDYGVLSGYCAPKNPHPDSILWRSSYHPTNPNGDILHDQAQFWGVRGVHYHQFLRPGENTLNLQLAQVLLRSLLENGCYNPADYLRRYITFLRTPQSHRDTYVEECHRLFFTAYASGTKPEKCGAQDIHIGGLASVPVLASFLSGNVGNAESQILTHVALTHRSDEIAEAALALARILVALFNGGNLEDCLIEHASGWFSLRKAKQWKMYPDEVVIGQKLSPACYIRDAFSSALYLSWKYSGNFREGILANAQVGGDNCHRAVVVGSLLAAESPAGVPAEFKNGLLAAQLLQHILPQLFH